MEFKRPHPIHVLENTTKYFYLLLLPLLRGLISFRGGLYVWLNGTWFDLLILLFILLMAILRWSFTRYAFDQEGVYLRRSFLFTRHTYLPYRQLTMICAESPFYLRPLGAVRIKADTDGGYLRRTDFSLTLPKEDAEALLMLTHTLFREDETVKRRYQPQRFYPAILSLITSSTLNGVLFLSALISQSGKLLGKEFEDRLVLTLTDLAQLLAFGLPPAAAILAAALLGGWLISFLMNVVRHIRFHVLRQGKSLEIRSGILTNRRYNIHTERINLIELRQNMITKMLGFFTVFIHCSGYGKQKNEHSILLPAADRYEVKQSLALLLPEIPIVPKRFQPQPRAISRFLLPPIIAAGGILLFFRIVYLLLPQFRDIILFLGIMAELPTVWWLILRFVSFFHTGIGKENGVYTFYYADGYGLLTTSVSAEKISQVSCRQTPFQRASNSCDLVILSYSEGKRKLTVPNLPLSAAKELFDFSFFDSIHSQKG